MTIHHLEKAPECRRCKSPDTELRRKVASNGTRMYAFQCLKCGENASGWIAHAKIPNINVPAWDETLATVYSAQHIQERAAQRQIERADWFHEHDEYLKSSKWRALRRKVLARASGLCEGCREKTPTQVHHLTYAHWQDELLWELVAVCDDCHERAHGDPLTQTGRPT